MSRDFNKLKEELEKKIVEKMEEVNVLSKELSAVGEKILENDPQYMKAECLNCKGVGWVEIQDKKKVCELCQGRRYMWVKKFKE